MTFVMKILPFRWSFAYLFFILGPVDLVLSFLSLLLLEETSLQQRRMDSKR